MGPKVVVELAEVGSDVAADIVLVLVLMLAYKDSLVEADLVALGHDVKENVLACQGSCLVVSKQFRVEGVAVEDGHVGIRAEFILLLHVL